MNAAIACLEQQLDALLTNEPIHRREGNVEQADLEKRSATEVADALAHLQTEKGYRAQHQIAVVKILSRKWKAA